MAPTHALRRMALPVVFGPKTNRGILRLGLVGTHVTHISQEIWIGGMAPSVLSSVHKVALEKALQIGFYPFYINQFASVLL